MWDEIKETGCQGVNTYTYNKAAGCNGWNGVDINTCKQFCMSNSLPDRCELPTHHTCNYIVYTFETKWCHLASVCNRRVAHWLSVFALYRGTYFDFRKRERMS